MLSSSEFGSDGEGKDREISSCPHLGLLDAGIETVDRFETLLALVKE